MNEHLKRLESGELNKRNTDKRKCVSSEALSDFVDIDHYFMPTLHLMIGIVKYLYRNMVKEAKAACEGYYLDYVKAERIWELSKYNAATVKPGKKTFQATNGHNESQFKRDLRAEENVEQQHLMEAELELLAEECSQMILEEEK